ncbi:hypothetical protein [Alteromonas confluentis]|uniref:Uncharacterized protein n=1 Tax=Alteromonas confluentis TaxID=1656094 RepID=A0A1E7Z997_9ALTE|nr:hypothetical protein [Alteromonas confluentis]OFC70106.1 hypothetical protein BFC18_13005 [Alteromonas confluentis]
MSNELVNKGLTIVGNGKNKERPIVVVGTARGGTSMVAGVLHHLGVFMGDKAAPPVFEDTHLSSAFERTENDEITEIIRTYNTDNKKWGWKRPSSINYLEKVNDFFDKPLYIFIFKDVLSIAQRNSISMLTEITPTMKQSLNQYLKCVEFLESSKPDALLISYDKALGDPKALIDYIINFYDLSPSKAQVDSAINFVQPNPKEYLDSSRITKAEGAVNEIYNNSISGWARYVHSTKPAEVRVYLNDKEIGSVTANLQNKFSENRLSRDCSFVFELSSDIVDLDALRVRVVNEVVDLPLVLNPPRSVIYTISTADTGFYEMSFTKGGELLTPSMLAQSWFTEKIVGFSDCLFLFLLKNDKGNDAVWYFNGDKQFVGNDIKGIKLSQVDISKITNCLMQSIFKPALFNDSPPPLVNLYNEFQSFRDEFSILLDMIGPDISLESTELECLREVFSTSTKNAWDKFSKDADRLVISVNYENAVYSCRHSIVINNFLIAYPYLDDKDNAIVIFESSHDLKRFLIYDFQNHVFYQNGNCYPVKLALKQVLTLFLESYPLISSYLGENTVGTCGFIRNAHIGHNLWNDLAGIDRLKKLSVLDEIGNILITGGALLEPWGKIEDIFDISPDKINRDVRSESDLVSYIFNNRLFAFRLTDDYISEDLANRLISNFDNGRSNILPRSPNEIRVVFGLRLENRTWSNQKEGFKIVMQYLSKLFSQVTIYVDGHDTIGSDKVQIVSHHEAFDNDIVGLEREIVKYLIESDKPSNVKIVDGVLMDLGESINWIKSSDFFICPWGAGLAKYKWVCNLPGVIFTSHWNINHKPDLNIYESNRYRQNAKECVYVKNEFIKDDEVSAINIHVPGPKDNPSRANFHVEFEGLKLAIDSLISEVGLNV